MRVISQDGTKDFPYDSSSVSLYVGCINGRVYVRMQICGYDDSVDVADYSTKEKAKKAMEMLRIAYENNEFYHHIADSEHFTEFTQALSNEMLKKSVTEYFQFPAEEELE